MVCNNEAFSNIYVRLFQHLEAVIKSRIPGLQSLINKTIIELETELSRLGKPIATDAGVSIASTPSGFIYLLTSAVTYLSLCAWEL